MRYCLALAATAAVLIAGCGGSSDQSPAAASDDKPTIRNASPWTEQQIIDALELQTQDVEVTDSGDMVPPRPAKPGDLGMQTTGGCDVSVLMTDKRTVDFYAEAGDTVVTNPDGTAGVKTSGDDPKCLAELERGLAKLR